MVIVNAELHYIGPIERTLATSPDVAEAYVTAAPPTRRRARPPHAFIVPAPPAAPPTSGHYVTWSRTVWAPPASLPRSR
ncbi:hypothetical protein [Nonomuraea salmonea]|uniref:hypothetical protein n=1 Tax=Nonomuraea salmonea TaxID=46181 RepID=UPI0031EF5115